MLTLALQKTTHGLWPLPKYSHHDVFQAYPCHQGKGGTGCTIADHYILFLCREWPQEDNSKCNTKLECQEFQVLIALIFNVIYLIVFT